MLKLAFRIAGFTFTVVMPLLMFGGIIPYTHDGKAAGFTTMGYIALFIFLVILAAKLRSRIKARPEGLTRGILLTLFPIGAWVLIKLGINKIVALASNIDVYWDNVLLFVIVGSMFYIAAEAMGERLDKK